MRSPQTFSGLFLAVLLAWAPELRAGDDPQVQTDFGLASRYVFRGVEKARASTQAGLGVSQDNFTGSLWTNQSLKSSEGRDLNLGAAYSAHFTEQLQLEAKVTQYWSSGGPPGQTKHSLEGGLTATLAPINGFTPSVGYFHDFRLRSDTTQGGLAYSIPLTGLGAFLDLNLFAGCVAGDDWRPDAPGPRRQDGYGYWGAEANLPYNISYLVPHSTLVAGLHYTNTAGRSALNGPFGMSGGRNFWVTLGVNLDF